MKSLESSDFKKFLLTFEGKQLKYVSCVTENLKKMCILMGILCDSGRICVHTAECLWPYVTQTTSTM